MYVLYLRAYGVFPKIMSEATIDILKKNVLESSVKCLQGDLSKICDTIDYYKGLVGRRCIHATHSKL